MWLLLYIDLFELENWKSITAKILRENEETGLTESV